ncbi:hypothetical protein SAMN05216251_10279 [Actinacidiphila alni]|uniref:Lipoprotein n=1 Tax=Actinacidiphila alni TaxID=380248 RepID=A0A1I1YLY2_9ACTN|nr:hypothetical protein [Actinacidiphila alni]SFE20312.1 hypothetical protein SAMN05216251_10279 [Actinacidiphila alni]
MNRNHSRRPRIPAAARPTLLALTLAGAALVGLTSACSFQDAQCSDGEYPAASVGSSSGGACFSDDEEPSKGFVRYPKGKVPKHVDDKWDKYWQKHTLDANGNETS